MMKGEKILGLKLEGKYIDVGRWSTVLTVEKEMMETHSIEYHIRERKRLCERMRA